MIKNRNVAVDAAIDPRKITGGTSSSPLVLTAKPADSNGLVKMQEVAIQHSGTAVTTGVTDLLGDYRKILVYGLGDPSMTPVGSAQRLYIGTDGNNARVSEAYAVQTFLTKNGTGTVDTLCGNSIVVNVGSNNFTASNRVQGLNVTLDGTATIATGKVTGISIDAKSGRTVNYGLMFSGVFAECVKFGSGPSISGGTATSDSTIKSEQGITAPAGSVYLSTSGVFVMVSTTWTALTIN